MTTTTNGTAPTLSGFPAEAEGDANLETPSSGTTPAQLDEIDGIELPPQTGGSSPDAREQARQVIRDRAAAGLPELSGIRLGKMFGRGERWGRARIAEVRSSEPVAVVGLRATTAASDAASDAANAGPDAGGNFPQASAPAVTGQPPATTAPEAVVDAARPNRGDSPTVAASQEEVAPTPAPGMPGKVAGAKGMYFVALMATVISANTSYRFFGEKLGIKGLPFTVPAFGPLPGFVLDLERVALFGVMEVALIVLAYAMRANVIRSGRPGPAQWVAWGVCGFAAFAAWELSGPVEGTARVLLGPVFGLVMLHLALGIEVKVRRGQSTGVWSQAGREVRERVLSRLGLGNDSRDALARIRDRAALRAARLAVEVAAMDKGADGYGAKVIKLRKALHASNIAHDPQTKDRMLRELATLKHAACLADVDQPAPW